MTRHISFLLTTLLFTAPLLAQSSEGSLVGTAATILVDTGTSGSGGPLNPKALHRKRVGFGGFSVPPDTDAHGDPRFTASEMFNGGGGPPVFDVNALSLGLDEVPATTPMGGVSYVQLGRNAWAVLAFSVTRDSVGMPGSLIEAEASQPGGVGADLFSLMLPGSTVPVSVAACYPTDRPQRALDASEMDLDGGAGNGEMMALDLYAPLYLTGPPIRSDLPDEPVVYFSVTRESLSPPGGGTSPVPSAWFDCGLPSSASILMTQWIVNLADPKGGSWTTPRVHIPYDELGLLVEDDIDALAVDRTDCKLLFSIRGDLGAPLVQQLQIASWPCDAVNCAEMIGEVKRGIYMVPAGTGDGDEPLVGRLRISSDDDVDTACVIDPGDQAAYMARAFGVPLGKPSFFKTLNAGLFRDDDDPAGPAITLTVSNLPVVPLLPYDVVEAWALLPPLMPIRVFLAPVGFPGTETYQLSLAAPALATAYGLQLQMFWVLREIGGTHKRESSAILAIEL
jgi:hypothetical protein